MARAISQGLAPHWFGYQSSNMSEPGCMRIGRHCRLPNFAVPETSKIPQLATAGVRLLRNVRNVHNVHKGQGNYGFSGIEQFGLLSLCACRAASWRYWLKLRISRVCSPGVPTVNLRVARPRCGPFRLKQWQQPTGCTDSMGAGTRFTPATHQHAQPGPASDENGLCPSKTLCD